MNNCWFCKKTRRCVDFCRANDQNGLQMTFWQQSSFWSLWLLRFECDLISHNWATHLSSHMNWWLRCTQKSSPRWSMLVPCPVAWPFARPFSKGIHMQNLHSTLWEETLRFLATNFSHSSGHAMLLCLERCFFFLYTGHNWGRKNTSRL